MILNNNSHYKQILKTCEDWEKLIFRKLWSKILKILKPELRAWVIPPPLQHHLGSLRVSPEQQAYHHGASTFRKRLNSIATSGNSWKLVANEFPRASERSMMQFDSTFLYTMDLRTVPRHHMGIQLLANWKSIIQSVLTCSPIASRKPTSTLNIPNPPPGQKLGPQTEKMCFKRSTNLGILHHHQGKSMQHRKKGSKLLLQNCYGLYGFLYQENPRKWYSVFGNLSPERGFPLAAAFSPNLPKIPNDSNENFQVPQFGKKLMVTPYLAVIFTPLVP